MRNRVLVGLAVYLACGVLFGLITNSVSYMCTPPTLLSASVYDGKAVSAEAEYGGYLREPRKGCFPILDAGDRIRWVATTTPAWLPLVVRNLVPGGPIQIDSIYLGDQI